MQLLVGSMSIQPPASSGPLLPHQSETQACEASAPTRRGRPGGGALRVDQAWGFAQL